MFKIKDGIIYLTRGDDAYISVSAADSSGSQIAFTDGDSIKLTVKEEPSADSVALMTVSGTFAAGDTAAKIHITSSSSKIPVGQYSADIQLALASGEVYTIYPNFDPSSGKLSSAKNWKNFWITPEVSDDD